MPPRRNHPLPPSNATRRNDRGRLGCQAHEKTRRVAAQSLGRRHRNLIAHAPVGGMARRALARQRLDPPPDSGFRGFRRRSLERVRIDNGPFAPPGVLDEAGLLEALKRRQSRIARRPFNRMISVERAPGFARISASSTSSCLAAASSNVSGGRARSLAPAFLAAPFALAGPVRLHLASERAV
jgi:hypothetical protein